MIAMATTAPPKLTETSSSRAVVLGRTAPARRRFVLAGACYLGMALIVALTVLAARVMSPGVGVPVFFLAMVTIVALLHPAIRVTRRN